MFHLTRGVRVFCFCSCPDEKKTPKSDKDKESKDKSSGDNKDSQLVAVDQSTSRALSFSFDFLLGDGKTPLADIKAEKEAQVLASLEHGGSWGLTWKLAVDAAHNLRDWTLSSGQTPATQSAKKFQSDALDVEAKERAPKIDDKKVRPLLRSPATLSCAVLLG